MEISEEKIHQKRQELGIEPPEPSHGPNDTKQNTLSAKMTSEGAENEHVARLDNQQFVDPPKTNDRNQYRYGGSRP